MVETASLLARWAFSSASFLSFSLSDYILGMGRRLGEFRSLNEEDTTVLNYFDEKEIHPEHISQLTH